MAQQTINVGTAGNDGTGDPNRTAFQKANANFTELYALVAALTPGITGTLAATGPGPDTASFAGTVGSGADTTTGLVARWDMIDGSGTNLHDQVASREGTLTDATLWSINPGYVTFDNSIAHYASIADAAVWDITPNLLVFAWVRGDVASLGYNRTIICRYDFTSNNRSWMMALIDNTAHLRVVVSDGGSLSDKDYAGSQTVVDAAQPWRSVAFRAAGNALDLFVNAVKDPSPTKNSDTTITGIHTSAQPIYIGCVVDSQPTTLNPMLGVIAGVRIYNSFKTDADIAAIHALGHP
jgi:Concanavalin A-like lectin/glucanases superfamily